MRDTVERPRRGWRALSHFSNISFLHRLALWRKPVSICSASVITVSALRFRFTVCSFHSCLHCHRWTMQMILPPKCSQLLWDTVVPWWDVGLVLHPFSCLVHLSSYRQVSSQTPKTVCLSGPPSVWLASSPRCCYFMTCWPSPGSCCGSESVSLVLDLTGEDDLVENVLWYFCISQMCSSIVKFYMSWLRKGSNLDWKEKKIKVIVKM